MWRGYENTPGRSLLSRAARFWYRWLISSPDEQSVDGMRTCLHPIGELKTMPTEADSGQSNGSTQVIRPSSIPSDEAFGMPTIWQTYSFAPEWFADALHEAGQTGNHHARRREIIFAVCFAESYLVEWVRDEVLNRDFNLLNQYFPPGESLVST